VGANPRNIEGPYVTFSTESGESVQVEIEPAGGLLPVSRDRSLGSVSFAVRPVIEAAGEIVREAATRDRPSEVQIRFGIKIVAGGVVIAKGAGEGNFEVTMTWAAAGDAMDG
jgi:hypothetical protein